MDLESYWRFQQGRLAPEIFSYTLSVMQAMEFAAKKYNFDSDCGKIAGLLHNLAAPMRSAEIAEYLMSREQRLLNRLPPGIWHKGYLMGPASAHLALELLDVREDATFSAIREHTGLFKNSCLMARCLRICTIIMRSDLPAEHKQAKLGQLFFAGKLEQVEKLLRHRVTNTLEKTQERTVSRLSQPGHDDSDQHLN